MDNKGFPGQILYNCINQVHFSTYRMFALSFSLTGKEYTVQFVAADFLRGLGEA